MRILGGQSHGRRLSSPRGKQTRPPLARMRQSIFSILGERVEGSRVLDLFAGAGALGLESLSRGAREAIFIERSGEAARVLERNLKGLGLQGRGRVVVADALEAAGVIDRLAAGPFDLIFLDPPFPLLSDAAGRERFGLLLESLRGGAVLAPGGVIILRTPRALGQSVVPPGADIREHGRSAISFIESSPGSAAP